MWRWLFAHIDTQIPDAAILHEVIAFLTSIHFSTSIHLTFTPLDPLHYWPYLYMITAQSVLVHFPHKWRIVHVHTTLPSGPHRSMSLRSSASERTSVSSPLVATHAMRPSG